VRHPRKVYFHPGFGTKREIRMAIGPTAGAPPQRAGAAREAEAESLRGSRGQGGGCCCCSGEAGPPIRASQAGGGFGEETVVWKRQSEGPPAIAAVSRRRGSELLETMAEGAKCCIRNSPFAAALRRQRADHERNGLFLLPCFRERCGTISECSESQD